MASTPTPTHSNLYIRNIPAHLDEQSLLPVFSSWGEVSSLRLFKSPQNPTKTAFALVKYAEIGQAQNAVNNLNGAQMGNSVLEVKFANADAGERSHEHAVPAADNLYVKGLPINITEDNLRQIFAPYGLVTMCRILHKGDPSQTHHQGAAALVRMSSVQEATRALQALQNQPVPGSNTPLQLRYADGPEQKARKVNRQQATGRMMQMPYGMNTPMHHGYSNGGYDNGMYGGHMSMMPNGEQPMMGHDMDQPMMSGHHLSPSPASLYVKNLPPTADKLFLYERFSPFGAILSVKVLQDEQGVCKGIAFVNFADQSSAARAVAALHNTSIGEKFMHVAFQLPRMR